MKKLFALLIVALIAFASITTSFAYSGTKTVYAYSSTSVRSWGNIYCNRNSYYCSGTNFSGSGSVTKITVRPKLADGTNAAYATTFQRNLLSGGSDYFGEYDEVDLWANTDVYNFGGSITGYWTF